jgi:serine/threonine protein phosphatase PrpC
MALGFVRSGIIPRCAAENMISGDVLLICSEGVSDFVSEEDIRICSEMVEVSQDSCMKAVRCLLSLAIERGSNENASVCLIKKR